MQENIRITVSVETGCESGFDPLQQSQRSAMRSKPHRVGANREHDQMRAEKQEMKSWIDEERRRQETPIHGPFE